MAIYLKAITIAGIISCDKLFDIFSKGGAKNDGRHLWAASKFLGNDQNATKTMMPNQKEGMATPVMEKTCII